MELGAVRPCAAPFERLDAARGPIIVQAAGHTGIVNTPLAHHAFSCSAVRFDDDRHRAALLEARALAGMAGGTHLVDLNQNRIASQSSARDFTYCTWPDVSPLRQYS